MTQHHVDQQALRRPREKWDRGGAVGRPDVETHGCLT